MANEKLLTIVDVKLRTQLSKRKLQYDISAGALPYCKFGRSVRFKDTDVEAYINSHRIGRRGREQN